MTDCLTCQMTGGCTLDRSQEPDHYEAHITVANADVEEFVAACKDIGVKAVVLDLQKKTGGIMKDMMTSSTIKTTYDDARAYVEEKAALLEQKGFTVVRKKLETTPWNHRTPSLANGITEVPPGSYFECHLPIVLKDGQRHALREFAAHLGMHLSRNTFKVREDGSSIVMMTGRSYDRLYENFAETIDWAVETLTTNGFEVLKRVVEYAIWDTKVNHDAEWTGHNKPKNILTSANVTE